MTTLKDRPLIMTGESVRATIERRKTETRRVIKYPASTTRQSGYECFKDWDFNGVEGFDLRGGEWIPFGDCGMCNGFKEAKGPGIVLPFRVGMKLWVKEGFLIECGVAGEFPPVPTDGRPFKETMSDGYLVDRLVPHYKATDPKPELCREDASGYHDEDGMLPWQSPLFLPRWASRLTLEVVSVKIERLNSITCADISREGIECPVHDFNGGFCVGECAHLRNAFKDHWQVINGKREGCSWECNPWIAAIEYKVAA